jgi:hypothetical protein
MSDLNRISHAADAISAEQQVAQMFHSLLAPISEESGKVIPVTMPHSTPHAIFTNSLSVPIAHCLPLTQPEEAEVTTSFFATGEFDESSFVRRCAFLSTAVDVEEEQMPEIAAPPVTVFGAAVGSQMLHHNDDTLTVSDLVIEPAEAASALKTAEVSSPITRRRKGFFSCLRC